MHLLQLVLIDLWGTESWTLGQTGCSGQASLSRRGVTVARWSATRRLMGAIWQIGRRRA